MNDTEVVTQTREQAALQAAILEAKTITTADVAMSYTKPDLVSEVGKVQNAVGMIRLREEDLVLPNKITLRRLRSEETKYMNFLPEPEKSATLDVKIWMGLQYLKVIATIEDTPHGKLLHVSVSFPKQDPSWGVLKGVRQALFPPNIDVMMTLPRNGDYVNVHDHCFHLWQCPEKWGLR